MFPNFHINNSGTTFILLKLNQLYTMIFDIMKNPFDKKNLLQKFNSFFLLPRLSIFIMRLMLLEGGKQIFKMFLALVFAFFVVAGFVLKLSLRYPCLHFYLSSRLVCSMPHAYEINWISTKEVVELLGYLNSSHSL